MASTTLSTKGQLVTPKDVRDRHGWAAGTELVVEDRAAVLTALAWHADGVDFADAVHLASSEAALVFATFDGELAKSSRGPCSRRQRRPARAGPPTPLRHLLLLEPSEIVVIGVFHAARDPSAWLARR